MPGQEDIFWHWSNLDIGLDLDLAGHKFHLYDCDEFTRVRPDVKSSIWCPIARCTSKKPAKRTYSYQGCTNHESLKNLKKELDLSDFES